MSLHKLRQSMFIALVILMVAWNPNGIVSLDSSPSPYSHGKHTHTNCSATRNRYIHP